MRIPVIYYITALTIFVLFHRRTRKYALSFLIPYMFLVFAQTVLIRGYSTEVEAHLKPLWLQGTGLFSDRDILNQMLANIVMFIPIGFLASFVVKKYAILLGFAFSSLIELIQLLSHRGFCETDDVISNTIGSVIGVILFIFIPYLRVRAEEYCEKKHIEFRKVFKH